LGKADRISPAILARHQRGGPRLTHKPWLGGSQEVRHLGPFRSPATLPFSEQGETNLTVAVQAQLRANGTPAGSWIATNLLAEQQANVDRASNLAGIACWPNS
jgi:hypothetical protein